MRIKIQYKITLFFALTLTIVLAGTYYYLNQKLSEDAFMRIRTNLTKDLALTKTFIEHSLEDKLSGLQTYQLADRIGQDLDLRVTLIDNQGKVLGDSDISFPDLKYVENHLYRPEVQDALKKGFGQSRRFSTTIQKDMLYIGSPYLAKNGQGVIRLSIPLSEIELISNKLRDILLVSLLIAFLFAMLIGIGSAMFVSNPIKQIVEMARSIAQGDLSQRTMLSTNDEIGDLSMAINEMADQIKQRLDEITANKTRFEAILLSMFDGVMVIDSKGRILLMNNSLRDLLHVEDDPVGKILLEVVRNIEIQEIANKVLERKEGVESREITLLTPSEKRIGIHATSILREDNIEGAVLVFHDITDLRRLETVRRDFVANVSHELRTPVTNIKGYAETLLDGAIDEKENAREFLEIISSDSDRLVNLVDDLLELSRIESGNLKLEIKDYDINNVIDRIIKHTKRQAKEKKVKIIKEIPEKLPMIQMDEEAITQVLYNLIDNAIKYNKENGEVRIRVEEHEPTIQITISDTGLGIPGDDLARIFERFYRVDKARSRQLGGTGLGLSIAKHIIQAHQGSIDVESKLAKGTIFTIKLPISQ